MKIMMVCLGNICRSPIAEGVLKHLASGHNLPWVIHSAGTGASYHEGASPHPHSISVCKKQGIDISGQRARVFMPSDFEQYDLIYAMSDDIYDTLMQRAGANEGAKAKIKLLLNEVRPGSNDSVPDPYYGNASAYPPVYNMIYEACKKIVEKYASPPAA